MNSVAEIDQGIFQTLVDLRGSSAQNDYSALEDRVLEIKGACCAGSTPTGPS